MAQGNKEAAEIRSQTGDAATAEKVLRFHRNEACNAFTRWINKWVPGG